MRPNSVDPCLHTRYNNEDLELAIMIYVDDILVKSKDHNTLLKAKKEFSSRFNMKDLGAVRWVLGIKISERPEGNYMMHTAYITKILERFSVSEWKQE